jgi:glucan 1,3-beta-glucosidase
MRTVITLAFLLAGCAIVTHCENVAQNHTRQQEQFWVHHVEHGTSSFHQNPATYQVYRNVMDFGCVGDGVADDTACINTAISSGGRCGQGCGSSTIQPALIYFPKGTYLIHGPIIMYYFSQLVGDARPGNTPVIKASPTFSGMAMIDSNPYGDGGNNWYTNQNNFFRQVRNFILDMTDTPSASTTTGIHWQVAQATSLFHIRFVMSRTLGTNHQGIWMENGSGGFMSDLQFEGGKYGMWVGNQQFLSRNLEFDNCDTAVYMNWNWQWTFKDLKIRNCRIGIDMSSQGDGVGSGVGSILLMDSEISDTPTGVMIRAPQAPNGNDVSATLLLDNVRVSGVNAVVAEINGGPILNANGVIRSWGRGSRYDASGTGQYVGGENLPNVEKAAALLDGQGNFFAKSRPQYEDLTSDDFVSVKANGARGDGVTDDSDAIQAVINANVNGKVVYIPAGSYVIGKTVTVPPGSRIIGETWSVLMAGGAAFQNEMQPQPMLKVGEPGQTGSVEITDLFFASKGAQPGAILVQWNIAQSSNGAAGLWDSHFRVGGFQGSELNVNNCPRGQGAVPQCNGVHTLLQIAATGSGYFENVWAWTADHDLDNQLAQGQISIYTGRGVLVESTNGPVWLYGTQSEHNVFSQYQLTNARNVFMTMIQSETPYWQPGPPAPSPYTPNPVFDDPTYGHCAPGDVRCPMSYAIRAKGCTNVYVYGAGMYNFFNNYDQTCLDTEDCQYGMVDLENNNNFIGYNLNTKAAVNMIVEADSRPLVVALQNRNGFCQTLNAFTG